MKNIPYLLLFIFLVNFNLCQADELIAEGQLVAEGIARFYPEGSNPDSFPKTMAFTKDPTKQADLPDSWSVIPKIIKEGTGLKYIFDKEEGTSTYGTGMIAGDLLRRNRTIFTWNIDSYIYTEKYMNLYQSHPWVLAVRKDGTSYGILANTSSLCRIDLFGKIEISTENADFYCLVIEGDSPLEVIQKLSSMIGTISMPPLWMLGFHQSRWGYTSEEMVRIIAWKFRDIHFPCDAIWVDINYMDEFKNFTFYQPHFPDPKGLTDYLRSEDYKSFWMINPSILQDFTYEPFISGNKLGIWVLDSTKLKPYIGRAWAGGCVFPDFTMPIARAWWHDQLHGFISDNKLDGICLDMNEPSVFDGVNTTMHKNSYHQGGGKLPPGDHAQYHNIYGMLSAKATYNAMLKAEPNKRPAVFARSNFIGGQRYANSWTGDIYSTWENLRWSVNMISNLSMSGTPISGADIGGYSGYTSPKIYRRWIGIGAFYPFCRVHSANTANPQEPWYFGEVTLEISRTAIERRYKILPYIYTLAYETYRNGTPILWPALFADPTDPRLRDEEQIFLLGSDLLIDSHLYEDDMYEKNEPVGIWNRFYLVDKDRENNNSLPVVKIRGGAIIPGSNLVESTNRNFLDTLYLYIRLDESGYAEGRHYEDAGDGWEFLSGDYLYSTYQAELGKNVVHVSIKNEEGNRQRPDRITIANVIQDEEVFTGIGKIGEGIDVSVPFTNVESSNADKKPKYFARKEMIRVYFGNEITARISLFDLLGIEVFSENWIRKGSNVYTKSLSGYGMNSGCYILKVESQGRTWFFKVLI